MSLLALGMLALIAPFAPAFDEVKPADRILVIEQGKSGKIDIKTDAPMNFSAKGSGVEISPSSVENKTKAKFKVLASAEIADGGQTVTITATPVKGGDGPATMWEFTVWTPLMPKDAEKMLKSATKDSEKAYGAEMKTEQSVAKDEFEGLLDQLEIALQEADMVLAGDGGGRSITAVRAGLLVQYLLLGMQSYSNYLGLFLAYYYSFADAALLSAQQGLSSYSIPIIAALAFLSSGNTAWGVFLAKMVSIASSNALKLQSVYRKYISNLVKLAVVYGITMPFLAWFPENGLHAMCFEGPAKVPMLTEAGTLPELPTNKKQAKQLFKQLEAQLDGGGDGKGPMTPPNIPPQVTGIVAFNFPNPGPTGPDDGTNHGQILVCGLAPPEDGDISIEITPVSGGIPVGADGGGALETIVVTAGDLDTNRGAFTVAFGSPSKGADAFAWGNLVPGLYQVVFVQNLFRIVKFINVPYYSEQTLK